MPLEIVTEENSWKKHKCCKPRHIKRVLGIVLATLGLHKANVCILLTNDKKMRELNFKFLGNNSATNVLSFPDMPPKELTESLFKETGAQLGDIAFGYQFIYQEALKHKLNFTHHFNHLLAHSILHCLGHDHDTVENEKNMWSLEDKILEKLGVKRHIRNAT